MKFQLIVACFIHPNFNLMHDDSENIKCILLIQLYSTCTYIKSEKLCFGTPSTIHYTDLIQYEDVNTWLSHWHSQFSWGICQQNTGIIKFRNRKGKISEKSNKIWVEEIAKPSNYNFPIPSQVTPEY